MGFLQFSLGLNSFLLHLCYIPILYVAPAPVPELEEEVLHVPVAIGLPADRLDHIVASLQWSIGSGVFHPGHDSFHAVPEHLVE